MSKPKLVPTVRLDWKWNPYQAKAEVKIRVSEVEPKNYPKTKAVTDGGRKSGV